MATIIRHTEEHYEVHEIPYGRDYNWCPESVIVECDCGERLSLTATETTCTCGADHTALVQEGLNSLASSEQTPSPKDECSEWRRHQEEYLRSEHNDQLEWEIMK